MKLETNMEGKESCRFTMDKEKVELINNDTWDLAPFPNEHNLVGCKWVFKKKIIINGSVEMHKVRLVAKIRLKL